MARRKTNDATDARLSFCNQSTFLELLHRRVRPQRRKVVVEDERVRVVEIARASRPLIARTQIASWIILGKFWRLRLFNLSLPRTVGPLRRYEHPLSRQRVVTTMWMV